MSVNVNQRIGAIKSLYQRAVNRGGSVALEKGKLLERIVRLYLKEKGYPVSKIAGSTHEIPDLRISAQRLVLSHSTLYLEDSVFECCNLKRGGYYRSKYMSNLRKRIKEYFKDRKIVYIICSYRQIFRGQLGTLATPHKRSLFIIELGFQITIHNLNRKLYEKVKRKLDNYF